MKEPSLFPYKTRSECYLCYEKVTGTTLHAFREKLYGRRKPNPSYKSSASKYVQPRQKSTPPQFQVEVNKAYVMEYMRQRAAAYQPVKIFYKDDKLPTIFHDYRFDEKYLYVSSGKGYEYKYLIERIRNVEF